MEDEKLDLFEFLDVSTELLLELEEAVCKIEIGKGFDENLAIIQESLDLIRKGAIILKFDTISPIVDHLRGLIFKRKDEKIFSPIFIQYLLGSSIHMREIFSDGGTQIRFFYGDPDEKGIDSENSEKIKFLKEIQNLVPEYNFVSIFEKLRQTKSEEDFGSVMGDYFEKRNPLIVVIDDDPNIADALESILEISLKIRMTHYLSAKEAFEKLEALSPDLIIIDYNMPEMSGLEFIKNSRDKLINIPIIFFTGYLDKDICLEALSSGADAIIEKPFSNEKIIDIVEHNLNKYSNFKKMINIINSLFYQFSGTRSELEQTGAYKVLSHQMKKLISAKDSFKNGKLKLNINI